MLNILVVVDLEDVVVIIVVKENESYRLVFYFLKIDIYFEEEGGLFINVRDEIDVLKGIVLDIKELIKI